MFELFPGHTGDVGGYFLVKVLNFLIVSHKNNHKFILTKTRELNWILSKGPYSLLTIHALCSNIIIEKHSLNNY